MSKSKLSVILAEEGLHLAAAVPTKPKTKKVVSQTDREAAILDLLKDVSVSGAVKNPHPVEEDHPGHSILPADFVKGLFKVILTLEYNASWNKPSVRLDGFAPDPQGDLEEVYEVRLKIRNVKPKPADINKALKAAFDLLEEKYQPLDSNILVEAARDVKTPAGFSREQGWGAMQDFYRGTYDTKKDSYHVVLTSGDENVRIIVNLSFYGRKTDISGHTNFLTVKGWFSFSRRGVDDSFHIGEWSSEKNINKVIPEEVKRALEKIDSYKEAVSVEIGRSKFTLTPDRLESIKALLKRGQATLAPAGFGTGYYLSAKPFKGRYDVGQTSTETAAVFGLPHLYYQSFDHD